MTRQFWPALVLIALTRAALPALGQDALAQARARGALRWGGDIQGGEPYAFQDPHDSARLLGFEVEIADVLARGSAHEGAGHCGSPHLWPPRA